MLERALLDEGAVGDVGEVVDEAHGETEGDDGLVGVEVLGAEGEDVAETFGWAVFAVDVVAAVGPKLGRGGVSSF